MEPAPDFLHPMNGRIPLAAYALAGFVGVFALALFSVSTLSPTSTKAAETLTLSGGTPTAGTGGVATNASVTTVASAALNVGTLGGTNFQAAAGFDAFNTDAMRDVSMLNGTMGWLVGDAGLIRKTTDGGVTWAKQTSGVTTNLTGVHFADANTGYAVGGAKILKTTNGGTTWSDLSGITPGTWIEISCTDTSTCIAVGSVTQSGTQAGVILKTTNGGLNWNQISVTLSDLIPPEVAGQYQDVVFANAATGWVAGSILNSGNGQYSDLILKTTNGGGTWTRQTLPRTAGTLLTRTLLDLAVVDVNTVYAAGVGGGILQTTNGGSTWTEQTSGTTNNVLAIECASASVCWATVNAGAGVVLETTDSGTTWATENVGTAATFEGLSAPSTTLALLVGGTRIVRSTNNGVMWTNTRRGDDDYLDVHVVSATEAYTAGKNGKILKSIDNGATWTEQTSGVSIQFEGIHCFASGTCWAVGASGTARKTSDGGTTWSAVTMPSGETSTFTGVVMLNASTVLIGTADSEIYRTTDGGATWATPASQCGARDFAFVDANTGYYVCESAAVYKTTDGGVSWTSSTPEAGAAHFGVSVVDANTVLVVGNSGKIAKTMNGGTSWSTQTSGITYDLRDIHCLDANTCWAVYRGVADASVLVGYLYTADGGLTWTNQAIVQTTGGFLGVHGISTSSMLIVGGAQAIYRPTSRVSLKTLSGNISTGSVTGDSLCTNVTYDASAKTITCAHGTLTAGTWYALVVDGGATGIQDSSANTMASTLSRAFRTAFASDASAIDIPSTSISSLYQEGYFLIPSGETTAALSQVTADIQIRQSVSIPSGSARVTLPDGVVLQKQGGGTFNITQIALSDATTTVTNVFGSIGGAIQYGLANATLTASTNVEVRLPVDSAYNGATLNVFRDSDGNFSGMNPEVPDFTCAVSLGFCAFNTTRFSYFVVILSGSPAAGLDSTPPPPPTELKALGDARRGVIFTWKDPTGTLADDLDRIQVYLRLGPARLLIGVAPPGTQKFTYRGSFLIAGGVYLINIAAVDKAGNRSPFTEELFFLPPSFLLFDDTEPPLSPQNVKAVGDTGVVTVMWDDPPISSAEMSGTIAVDDLAGIEVYRVIGGKPERRGQINPGGEIFVDKDDRLVPGDCYTYALVAIDLAGNASTVVTTLVPIGDSDCGLTKTITEETPAEIQSLPPPTNPSASSTNGQVRLVWVDPTSAGITALHVLLFEGDDQKLRGTVEVGKQTFTDMGKDLAIGRSYRYAVQAVGEQERISDVATVGIIVRGADLPVRARADVPEGVVDFLADAPCNLSLGERSFLAASFRKSQGRPPTRAATDLSFLCGLRIDPRNPVADVTTQHPELRNTNAEELALKNFVNFFGRPPSKGFDDTDVPTHIADRDWAAVKHMAYHFLVATTARDMRTERACIRMFTEKQIDLYKRNPATGVYEKTLKPAGVPPAFGDEEDRAFIDACSYSGARFIGVETQRTARTVAEPLPTGTGGE